MFTQVNGLSALKQWMDEHQLTTSAIDMTIFNQVNDIKNEVITNGDQALCDLTKQFDQVSISKDQLIVPKSELKAAYNLVSEDVVSALKNAAQNIREYHLKQRPNDWQDQTSGRTYGVQYRPLDAVGLYVPGGRAAYPSSVLMTAIPAVIAGCKRIVMVSPPTGGQIPPIVLVAADIAGVTEVIQVGGAQAVFGLAFGTSTIQSVDKIVGPGNRYVTAAKQMVYGVVDIDKPAGPSEVCVVVDQPSYTSYAAAEMWAQLEHDPDASAICIVKDEALVPDIQNHAADQLNQLNRQEILAESKHNGVIVTVKNHEELVATINHCASEHLVIISDEPTAIREQVNHAGSIFCGPYTPVTLGDYYAGPNHVLPTARSARFASPLGVMDYVKYSSYLEYTHAELETVADDIDALTTVEGFDGHNQAVKVRLK